MKESKFGEEQIVRILKGGARPGRRWPRRAASTASAMPTYYV
jgi:hypothetical protein